jgi:hypothetical protein
MRGIFVMLTPAQLRILRRLAEEPDAMLITESRDRGYLDSPSFHAQWHHKGCPTCGHRGKAESASWRAAFALQEAGLIKELIPGGGVFTAKSITAAGRAALSSGK